MCTCIRLFLSHVLFSVGEVTFLRRPGASVRVITVEPALHGLEVLTLVPLGQLGVFTVGLVQRQVPQLYRTPGHCQQSEVTNSLLVFFFLILYIYSNKIYSCNIHVYIYYILCQIIPYQSFKQDPDI